MIRGSIPGLIVADGVHPVSYPPDALPPDVEVCHDARGDLLGYCLTKAGTLHVDLPDLASFSYDGSAGHVRAVRHRPLSPGFITETYHHCVLPLLLPALGTEVLHASAVAGPAGVTALCAESGTGKSTMAVALARRGYAIWADDAVAVDTTGGEPTAVPLPFSIRLRADAVRFLHAAGERDPFPAQAPVEPPLTRLVVLCMLRRNPEQVGPVVVERLHAAAACRQALAHAYCFTVKDPAQRRRTIQNYLTLAARVPAYEIRFRPGFDRLPMILDAIEEIVGGASAKVTHGTLVDV